MKIFNIFALALAIGVITSEHSEAVEQEQCSKLLLEQYRTAIENTFKGWRSLTLDDLNPDDQSIWTKARGGQCPGIVDGRFFPDSNSSVAILLISGNQKTRDVRVVVARELTDGKVSLRTVLEEKVTNLPVIHKAGPGRYKSFDGSKTMTITTDAIVYEHLESRVIALYYTKDGFKRLAVSD